MITLGQVADWCKKSRDNGRGFKGWSDRDIEASVITAFDNDKALYITNNKEEIKGLVLYDINTEDKEVFVVMLVAEETKLIAKMLEYGLRKHCMWPVPEGWTLTGERAKKGGYFNVPLTERTMKLFYNYGK